VRAWTIALLFAQGNMSTLAARRILLPWCFLIFFTIVTGYLESDSFHVKREYTFIYRYSLSLSLSCIFFSSNHV